MRENIITALKLIIVDRLVTILLSVFILLCLIYCLYVGLSLRPSELQVAVHYTSFGETNFYRAKWYYLLSFIAFGLGLAAFHTILAIKLYVQERRQIALAFIALSFLLLLIAWIMTRSILKVAFL
jgi:hypothetical protein